MPGGPRGLPDRPNLRFLKLEAKRRHADGEFVALHDAQLAIAREHGLANWSELKRLIEPHSHAVGQLRWIVERFRDASEPGWTAPAPRELREHFEERFLAAVPGLVRDLTRASPVLSDELVSITLADPYEARAELAELAVHLATEPAAPYRVTGLVVMPVSKPIADERITGGAPARSSGNRPAPAGLTELAGQLADEFGVPALALAGADPAAQGQAGLASWVVTRGWADMDRAEPLRPEQPFSAPGISLVVTATAVLRLVADGRCGLDDRANTKLRTLRLADDAITIRDLLASVSGVNDPDWLIDDVVPDLVSLLGPVAACDGRRGVFRPSNAGAGVLGQIVEDITGMPYAAAMTELVLTPLGMRASRFPASTAGIGDVVTGYATTRENTFEPAKPAVCTIQAAGGLWSTAADIARLGTGWAALLPAELAREALTPQLTAPGDDPGNGVLPGFGWLLSTGGDSTAMIAGALPGATAGLFIRVRDHRAFVILASRLMPLDDIDRQARPLWFS